MFFFTLKVQYCLARKEEGGEWYQLDRLDLVHNLQCKLKGFLAVNLPPVSTIPMDNFPPVLLIPVVHPELRISLRNIERAPIGKSGAPGKMIHEKT
jgi:hypothetical protein